MIQYIACIMCGNYKERMMIYKGNSYCIECLNDKFKRENEAADKSSGLSDLFRT